MAASLKKKLGVLGDNCPQTKIVSHQLCKRTPRHEKVPNYQRSRPERVIFCPDEYTFLYRK
jgi:hypothetical protein